MIEVLTDKGLEVRLENGWLVVLPKKLINDDLRDFIRRNKPELVAELKQRQLEALLSTNAEMKTQFEFEIEERAAIMTFDGGLIEAEAVKLARADVERTWLAFFAE